MRSASINIRHLLHTVHLWIGVVLSIPLFLLGITGSILVFEHDIEDWLEPRPQIAAGESTRPIGELVAAARAAAPRGMAPVLFFAPAAGEPAEVRLRGGAGVSARVFIDPSTASVLAVRDSNESALRSVALLHSNLLIRDRSGRSLVGWLGVAMFVLGLSGLVMWWPYAGRWRAAFRFDSRLSGAAFLRELHRTAGFWGLVVFLIVTVSGIYLAFPQTLGDAIRTVAPARDVRGFSGPAVQPLAGTQPLDLDGAVALVRAQAPGLELRSVGLPARPDQPIRVSLAPPEAERGPVPMLVAFVDPWRRQIVELRDPATYTAAESLMAWQRALHAGEGFGWGWRILVFVSGFLPVLFTITGCTMWLMRRRSRRKAVVVAAD